MKQARLALLTLLLALTTIALAQQHPNQQKGFDPAQLYQFEGIDNINAFNGNLVITIPLGQGFKGNGSLSYGLKLVYNGNVWDYGSDGSHLLTTPNRRSNAGLGWLVSLGRLIPPTDPSNQTRGFRKEDKAFVYEAPDGSDHKFGLESLFDSQGYVITEDPSSGTDGAPALPDSMAIRMSKDGAFQRKVELPDGSIQIFQDFRYGTGKDEDWRLVEMSDRFGNKLKVSYSSDSLTWTLQELPAGRTHTLYFHREKPPHVTHATTVLDKVSLAAFGSSTATADYTFTYAEDTNRPGFAPRIDLPGNDQSASNGGPGNVRVPLLTSVKLPSGETYDMTTGDDPPYAYWTTGFESGLLKSLSLPTGARIAYTWAVVQFTVMSGRAGMRSSPHRATLFDMPYPDPRDCDYEDPYQTGGYLCHPDPRMWPELQAPPVWAKARAQAVGVATRTLSVNGEPDRVWTYEHKMAPPETCTEAVDTDDGSTALVFYRVPHQKATIVRGPDGTTTVSYSTITWNGTRCESSLWSGAQYGRPLTRYISTGSENDPYGLKYLSTRTYTGDVVTGRVSNPGNDDEKWSAVHGGTLLRSRYVAFDLDSVQRIEGASRTVNEDDGGCGGKCYSEEYRFGFDRFGQFKQVSTGGNLPDGQVYRTTFRNYSDLPSTGEWVIGTYTEECSRDEAAARKTAVTDCKTFMQGAAATAFGSYSQFCFDRTNGFLQGRRTLKGAQPGAADILTVYEGEPRANGSGINGNIRSEKIYGGDTQATLPVAENDADACSAVAAPPATPVYGTTFTYSAGSLATARPIVDSGHWDVFKRTPIPYDTVHNTIDPSTGLVSQSTEPSGITTTFQYDSSGRLSVVRLGNGQTKYSYHAVDKDHSSSDPARVTVEQISGSETLTQSTFYFDELGRISREEKLLPASAVAVRTTEYGPDGRKKRVSEWETTPTHYTSFAYDALGRLESSTAPDGSTTSYSYVGTREKRQKVRPSSDSEIWTIEQYDSLGRLAKLIGPQPAVDGAPKLKAGYQYDAADRLISVSLSDAGNALLQPARTFVYDGLGFLQSESHPENGVTSYGLYDAKGHVGSKQLGAGGTRFDQKMFYDGGERLVRLDQYDPQTHQYRPLKTFSFGQSNGSDDIGMNQKAGKLEAAVRYNYGADDAGGNRTVTTSYGYYDAAGRVGAKTTSIEDGPSFRQRFTYDGIGEPDNLTFPTCQTGCGTAASSLPGDRATKLNWSRGLLDSITGFATSIHYHPNGMLAELKHSASPGRTAVTDTWTPDHGMPRPDTISVSGYCTGPPLDGPADVTIAAGDTARLSIPVPANVADPRYQWYSGEGQLIPNATGRIYETLPLNQDASFRVRVTDGPNGCPSDSRVATVHVKQCSTIVVHEISVADPVVAAGGSTHLTAAVEAPPELSLTYQWHQVMTGESGAVDTIVATGPSSAYDTTPLTANTRFWVRVSSGGCISSSPAAVVRVCTKPSIVVAPESQTAEPPAAGQSVVLSTKVVADGENVRYQWYEKTSDAVTHEEKVETVDGATTDTLSIPFTEKATRKFFVRVIDDTSVDGCRGSVDSNDVVFSVADCLKVVASPMNLWVYENSPPIQLAAEVVTNLPAGSKIHFEWRYGEGAGVAFSATDVYVVDGTSRYRGTAMAFINQPFQTYWCVITSTACSGVAVTHKSFITRWGTCPLPPVTVTPKQATATLAQVSFTVGCDWPDVTYQWYIGESGDTHLPYAGKTTNKLTVGSIVRSYWCRVTDGCGLQHRDTETVRVVRNYANGVCSPPVIAAQPHSVDIAAGEHPTLSIDATGVGLTFQWWEVGGGMAGTGPVFVAPPVTKTYYVKLLSSCDTGTTEPAESAWASVRVATCNNIHVTQAPAVQLIGNVRQLSVAASSTDGSTVTYQWYEGPLGDLTRPLPGSAVVPINPQTATSYWVRISTPQCSIDSAPIEVRSCTSLSITRPPFGGEVTAGQAFLLEAAASGTNLTYKWHIGAPDGPLAGTSPGVWVVPTDTTAYIFETSDACGNSVFSAPITVFACVAPAFTTQPHDARAFSGQTASLKAKATESKQTPIRYQLFEFPGNPIGPSIPSDGGEATFVTPAVTQETKYFVRATAGACSTDSNVVSVLPCTLGEIVGSGGDYQVQTGQTVHLRVGASDFSDPNNTYEWYPGDSGGTIVPGSLIKTGNDNWVDITTVNPTTADPVTKYWARVTNADGCVSKTPTYFVRVCVPKITQQPVGGMINTGQSKTLTVVADTPGVTYQWYTGESGSGTPISGETSPSITVHPTADTSYWVQVLGMCATRVGNPVASATARVTICRPPAITGQPQSANVSPQPVGGDLSVTATGDGLTYQWYQGLSGDTTTPLGHAAIQHVSPTTTTPYWVRVGGACGNTVDSVAAYASLCATITQQPAAAKASVMPGSITQLTVAATGSYLSYQWYVGDVGVRSQPLPTHAAQIQTPALNQATTFWVEITSGTCTVSSQSVTVAICNTPVSWQTVATNVRASQSQAISVNAPAGMQITFYRGPAGNTGSSVVVAGPSTSATATVAPATTSTYWARATDGNCSGDSPGVTVNVCVPTITSQPSSQTITSGQSATLSVTTDIAPLGYTWYTGAPGTTTQLVGYGSSITVTPSATTSYWVRITSTCGPLVDSSAAIVTVCNPPRITSQPVSAIASPPNGGTLSLTATGDGLRYQWYAGAAGVTSAPVGTNAAILTQNPAQTTQYWARVTGNCGSADTVAALISVCASMTQQPAAAAPKVMPGGSTTITAAASGTFLSYQWFIGSPGDTTQPVGGNSPTLATGALTHDTTYWVRVQSGDCRVNSNAVTVTVCTATASWSSALTQVRVSQLQTLSINAPAGMQATWYQGTAGNVAGSTVLAGPGPAYSLNVSPPTTKTYWVRVTDGVCTADTPTLTVSVCVPRVTTQPASQTVAAGSAAHLVVATDLPGSTYQWYTSAGAAVPGATGSTLDIAPSATTSYWVRVTGTCGQYADSNTAVVTVCNPPRITQQPWADPPAMWYSPSGGSNLQASATGDGLHYQWYVGQPGNTASPIGTNSSFIRVSPTTTTTYWLRVTGNCGTVDSSAVTVAICQSIVTRGPTPADNPVFYGNTTTISIATSGGTPHFHWYIGAEGDRSQPVGGDSTVLTTPPIHADTTFWVEVTNGACIQSAGSTVVYLWQP